MAFWLQHFSHILSMLSQIRCAGPRCAPFFLSIYLNPHPKPNHDTLTATLFTSSLYPNHNPNPSSKIAPCKRLGCKYAFGFQIDAWVSNWHLGYKLAFGLRNSVLVACWRLGWGFVFGLQIGVWAVYWRLGCALAFRLYSDVLAANCLLICMVLPFWQLKLQMVRTPIPTSYDRNKWID